MYPAKQTFFVLGISKSGRAAAEFLLKRKANVYIYDDLESERIETTIKELEKLGAKRVEKARVSGMYEICDVLVLSPGIPIDHPLAVAFKRSGRAVVGETELAARYMRCPVVAVTGTNGKTTAVSMLEKILSSSGVRAQACGNAGSPMIDYADFRENEIAVAEISSFQLETLGSLCPHIGVVLNITEDHLNRHYNMENYIFLKAKLLKNSTESEYAVLNYDDAIVRSFAEKTKARVVWFSSREKVNGAYTENGNLCFSGETIMPVNELSLVGAHNVQNALAAICAAKLLGVDAETIAGALSSFKGVRHRLEFAGEVDGVKYINDSKGTNVDATLKAISCMKEQTVLLLGGKDKGYDYDKLFAALRSSTVAGAILYGENRFRLFECAARRGYFKVSLCAGFRHAVRLAKMTAKAGQTVLLSPASASFDEFAGFEERGDEFVACVREFEKEGKCRECACARKAEKAAEKVEYFEKTECCEVGSADKSNDTDRPADCKSSKQGECESVSFDRTRASGADDGATVSFGTDEDGEE